MSTTDLGEHLARHNGRYSWTGWHTQRLPLGGVAVYIPCDLGHHWLAQDFTRRLHFSDRPYAWPTQEEALAAAARYEADNAVV